MLLKLLCQMLMTPVSLGDNKNPGGIFINPVNDPRSQLTPDPSQVLTMVQQSVNQGSTIMSGSGVYHHPSRLVNHDQLRVFVEYFERKIFWNCFDWFRLRAGNNNQFAASEFNTHLSRGTIQQNLPGTDHLFDLRATQFRKTFGKKAVEPFGGAIFGKGQLLHRLHLPDRTLDFAGLLDHHINNGSLVEMLTIFHV